MRNRLFVLTALLLLHLSIPTNAQLAEVNVDHYSGTGTVIIPIGQVTMRNFAHAINLTYNTSGVKVDDQSGSAGNGWTLSAGGEVKRILRGLPDDYYSSSDTRRGWLYSSNSGIPNYSFPADGSTLNCANESSIFNYLNNFNYIPDTEPDVFEFSGAGISGSFVFDNTGGISNVNIIPYQEVKITALRTNSNSSIHTFEILTATGTKYTYATLENTTKKTKKGLTSDPDPIHFRLEYHLWKTTLTYTSAWKLTKIETIGGETMNFGYSNENIPAFTTNRIVKGFNTTSSNYSGGLVLYNVEESSNTRHLTSITSPHQEVSIVIEPRSLFGNKMLISEINVYEVFPYANVFVKSYEFITQEFAPTLDLEESGGGYRPFLGELRIRNACETLEPYKFQYHNSVANTLPLPPAGSKKKDIWGYYTEPSGGTYELLGYPKLYIYPSLTGINRVSLFQKIGTSGEIIIPGMDMLGAATPSTGVLSKITQPTGSIVELTYSPHEFLNPITNAVSSGGGLRVSMIKTHDGISYDNDIIKTFEYTKTDGTTSGKLVTLPTFWNIAACYTNPSGAVTQYSSFSSMSAEEQWKRLILRTEYNLNKDYEAVSSPIVYERITEKTGTGQGKIVYQFEPSPYYGEAPTAEWAPTYTHIARPAVCPSAAVLLPGYYNAPFPPQSPFDHVRGLIKNVSHYREGTTNPITEVISTYVTKSVGAATVKGLQYEYIPYSTSSHFFTYGIYKMFSNQVKLLSTVTEKSLEDDGIYRTKVSSFDYAATDHALMTKYTSTGAANVQQIKRIKYAKDFGLPGALTSDLQVNMIDKLNTLGYYGVVVEETNSILEPGQPEKTNSGSVNLFDDFGTTTFPVILPKETHILRGVIPSYTMTSFSGSGATRTFTKSGLYKRNGIRKFNNRGDLIRSENEQRVQQSRHVDIRSGLPIAGIVDAEPYEIVYSGFDHETDYDFDLTGFSVTERLMSGRTGRCGLGGWKPATTNKLTRQFTKKPASNYIFSAWYKAPVITGTHQVRLTIKDLSGNSLLTEHLNFTITAIDQWVFSEKSINLSSIGATEIVAEITFTGTYTADPSLSSTLDEILLAPIDAEIARTTFNPAFGKTSTTSVTGRITQFDYEPAGKLKYIRDHDGNIIQKNTYSSWLGVPSIYDTNPVNFTVPSPVYAGTPAIFPATLGCTDVAAIEWKIGAASAYVSGTTQQPLTFPAAGTYAVYLRVSHPTYGSFERTKNVTVTIEPLAVTICVQKGAVSIDQCAIGSYQEPALCSGPGGLDPGDQTIFAVSVSGCSGGTYTYSWKRRYTPSGSWTTVGSGTTVTIQNSASYEVRCEVTSSCGKTGTSNTRTVTIYSSEPGCTRG